MDREEIKRYLNKCTSAQRSVKRLEQDIAQFRAEKMSIRHIMDGMPHASWYGDLSDYAAKLDELERKLIQARYERVAIYTDIFDLLEQVEDETYRELLSCRYLRGYTWDRIADEMQYCVAQVHRIHNKALEEVEMICAGKNSIKTVSKRL